MIKRIFILSILFLTIITIGCANTYKARPLSFKTPVAYNNMVQKNGLQVGGQAFADPGAAKEAFGFDIRAAGMLPVQLVFDNQSPNSMEINPSQTFLEDQQGNLWPILSDRFAYERATKYAQDKEMFKEGAHKGFLGAMAGTLIGAAIGIVTGEDVGRTAGEGAIIGAAAGSVMGGAAGYNSGEARASIISDLKNKSLKNHTISAGDLAHGIIFFPGEAKSAKTLRLQLKELETGKIYTLYLKF